MAVEKIAGDVFFNASKKGAEALKTATRVALPKDAVRKFNGKKLVGDVVSISHPTPSGIIGMYKKSLGMNVNCYLDREAGVAERLVDFLTTSKASEKEKQGFIVKLRTMADGYAERTGKPLEIQRFDTCYRSWEHGHYMDSVSADYNPLIQINGKSYLSKPICAIDSNVPNQNADKKVMNAFLELLEKADQDINKPVAAKGFFARLFSKSAA